MLLVVISNTVMAEWNELGTVNSEDDGTLTIYADPTSVRKSGNTAKILTLFDYQSVQTIDGKEIMSVKMLNEFKCNEKLSRMAYNWFYAEPMGDGKVTWKGSHSENKFKPFKGSVNLSLLEMACNKGIKAKDISDEGKDENNERSLSIASTTQAGGYVDTVNQQKICDQAGKIAVDAYESRNSPKDKKEILDLIASHSSQSNDDETTAKVNQTYIHIASYALFKATSKKDAYKTGWAYCMDGRD